MDEVKDKNKEKDTEKDSDNALRYQIGRQIQQEIKKETKPAKADVKRYNEGLRGEIERPVKIVRVEEEHLELQDWLLLIVLAGVPLLGMGVLIHGICRHEGPKERAVFCKACLIYQVVILLLVLFFVMAGGGTAGLARLFYLIRK